MKYQTEQEAFWAGEFGNEYITRNQEENLVTTHMVRFANILKCALNVKSALELRCNIGINPQAFYGIYPNLDLRGYEINETAANIARSRSIAEIVNNSILKAIPADRKYDLTSTRTVLIHINPDHLFAFYRNLYELSNKYVLICEFYNPSPAEVNYRGYDERLYKRDFAGEMINENQHLV